MTTGRAAVKGKPAARPATAQQLALIEVGGPLCCRHCRRLPDGSCAWTVQRGPHDKACFECGPHDHPGGLQ